MVTTILLLITLLCIGVAFNVYDGELIGFLAVIAGFATVISIIAIGIAHMEFRPAVAQIEQVRASVEALGCSASEDVIGKATDANMLIASKRVWNSRIIGAEYIPNGWETVEPITIPNCR